MARLVGRYAPRPKDLSNDPGPEDTTSGFKVTRRGPGIERFEPALARHVEHVDLRGVVAGHVQEQLARRAADRAAAKAGIEARVAARAAAAAAARTVVEVKPLTPKQEAEVHAERRALRIREALRSQDPMADKTVNSGLHVVDTPGGVAKYHAERERAAIETARGMSGKDRAFALRLAKEHGDAKRSAEGQKRVPAGEPTGGQWTK